jgi:hypothetical protein
MMHQFLAKQQESAPPGVQASPSSNPQQHDQGTVAIQSEADDSGDHRPGYDRSLYQSRALDGDDDTNHSIGQHKTSERALELEDDESGQAVEADDANSE